MNVAGRALLALVIALTTGEGTSLLNLRRVRQMPAAVAGMFLFGTCLAENLTYVS
jgi:hypothetical protein